MVCATPIPRTLAVILYGDLDISVVNELPANRLPVKNCVVDTSYRPKAYRFIEKQVKMGHQAYIICPMVEESEQIEAEDVISYTEKLRSTLPVCVCGLYLGMGQTFAMLFYALLFCSVVSAVMLVCKKRTYKTGVPFVPYLIAGYLCTFL